MTELIVAVTPAVRSPSVATTARVTTPSVIAYSAIVWPLSGPATAPNWFMRDPLSVSVSGGGVWVGAPRLWESSITLWKEMDGARVAGLHVRGGVGMARRPGFCHGRRPPGARRPAAAGAPRRRRD